VRREDATLVRLGLGPAAPALTPILARTLILARALVLTRVLLRVLARTLAAALPLASSSTIALSAALPVGTAATTDLTPQARMGRQIFFDASLSASGSLSCASCHDPANAYAAPTTAGVVMKGGTNMDRPGLRAVPSLRYLSDTPRFSRHTYIDVGREREDVGPAGGLMLDGRADNLRAQMLLPLLDPAEMANSSVREVAAKLARASYSAELRRLPSANAPGHGPQLLVDAAAAAANPDAQLLLAAATALERFELEDPSFHPYNSRFDKYLHGGEALTADELEGLRLFVDPAKANCAACHTATTGPGGSAPTFTDHSYHALGVPRNPAIHANADPRFFDLGLCGPRREDLHGETRYCGYFKTPTLRNVTRRRFFFHNGRFTKLSDVMHFYVERDTDPRSWYPTNAGNLRKFDDMPARYRGNVNISDAPLNRGAGDTPALDDDEIAKVIAFLGTLSDAD
jgi:cytochrome c peroxidase